MEITITATFAVDGPTWANEYHITPNEVREDVKSYLTTALSDLSEMLQLKGTVK